MKKILIGLFLLFFTISTSYSQDLHKYSTQEVLNIVLNDPAAAINFHHYSSQEVLNIALDETNSALKADVEGVSIDVDGRIVVDGLVVIDPTSLAGESLDEVAFTTHAEWDVTNDFVDSGGNAAYTWSANQTSTLTQLQASLVIAGVADVYYKFTYTIAITTSFDGDGAATITTAFALAAVSLDLTAGTHTVYFRSAAAPTDFIISVVSGTDTRGTFTIDDVTLKQITGGRIDIAGDLWVNGTDVVAAIAAGSDDQKIDVFSIAGDNVQLSLEDDGEATKTVDISTTTAVTANTAKVTNTDDQKIDVFSGAGNTISISLETDGEANKTLDISGFTAIAANTAKTGVTTEIKNVVEDLSPQLGANLDIQAFNLTGSGLWQAGTVAFGKGGTGLTTWTQYLIPYAATTTSFGQIAIGTNGQVLTSAGAGVAPSFQDAAGGGDFSDGGEVGGADRTLGNTDAFALGFKTNNVERAQFTAAGHFRPFIPNTYDLGGSANAWNKTYSNYFVPGNRIERANDADTYIDYAVADQLRWYIGNVKFMEFTEAATDYISMTEGLDIDWYMNYMSFNYGNKDFDWSTDVQVHYGANATEIHDAKTVTYDSGTTTVYCDRGNYQFLTFGAGNITTLDFADMVASQVYDITLIITQDGTGSRTIGTWDAAIDWEGGAAPTLITTANSADVLNFIVNGTGIIYGKLLSTDVR